MYFLCFYFFAQRLLSNGANVDAALTSDGSTPLYIAAQKGHLKCVEVRFNNGIKYKTQFQSVFAVPLSLIL